MPKTKQPMLHADSQIHETPYDMHAQLSLQYDLQIYNAFTNELLRTYFHRPQNGLHVQAHACTPCLILCCVLTVVTRPDLCV